MPFFFNGVCQCQALAHCLGRRIFCGENDPVWLPALQLEAKQTPSDLVVSVASGRLPSPGPRQHFLALRKCSEQALLKVFQFVEPGFQFLSSLAGYYVFSHHCPVVMSGGVRAVKRSPTAAGRLSTPGNSFQVERCLHVCSLSRAQTILA